MDKKKKFNYKRKLEPISIKGHSGRGKNPYINFDPRDFDPKNQRSESVNQSLRQKADKSELPLPLLTEVYARGLLDFTASNVSNSKPNITPDQWAFARVNSFIAGGRAMEMDEDLVCEAKLYRISKQTSNKSLGRLARRKDTLGAQARAELQSRHSHVFSTKREASKTLGDVLGGKAKMDHSTAKKIIRTLGMNPKSAAAKTLTATGRAHDAKKAENKIRRRITKEVKAKTAAKTADLVMHLKKIQTMFNEPKATPMPATAPQTHSVGDPGGPNLHLPKRADIRPDVGPKTKPRKPKSVISKFAKYLHRKP